MSDGARTEAAEQAVVHLGFRKYYEDHGRNEITLECTCGLTHTYADSRECEVQSSWDPADVTCDDCLAEYGLFLLKNLGSRRVEYF